jgi:hypothetical protein
MYGIVTSTDNYVCDNTKDPSGEPRKGVLLFKKKTNAVDECESLNKIRASMKITQCYSVAKFDPTVAPEFGFILECGKINYK